MSENEYDIAFDISPVPVPSPDAVPPDLFRGIYGMPMFVTIPTANLTESVEFWTGGLGFFDLFSIPGQLVHLRRWAFQDVLLVPAETNPAEAPQVSVSFACVLSQIGPVADACRALGTGTVDTPVDTPWNTRDLKVITPEQARVVFTAAKPFDAESVEAANLAGIGIAPLGGKH